jgi:surface polysaccharide O-acyltransferase-like enzyme
MQPDQAKLRNQSVDVIRVVAVMAVIVIHIAPFTKQHVHIGVDFNLGVLINQLARFAVPFFFVISGYFWAARFRTGEPLRPQTLRMAKRIAFLFLVWSALYLLPTNVHGGPLGPYTTLVANLREALYDPEKLLFEGTKVHLWFLVALLWSLGISALFISYKLPRTLMVVAVLLYLIGLSGKAYADTPLGFHSAFNFRDGPFFGTLFFVSGYFLQRRGPQPSWLACGMLLVIAGFTLHFGELILLKHYWGTSTMQDYLLGTYFVGVGVAMVAFANPRSLRISSVAAWGPLVAGIYVIHFAFIELLQPLDQLLADRIGWEIAYPLTVFLVSLAAVAALFHSRLKWLLR